MAISEAARIAAIRSQARPLTGAADDLNPLFEQIREAHLVLIGEASHGSEEFYRIRAAITKRLIAERGFTAVAAEADWPDAYRVNRFVKGIGHDDTPGNALLDFQRFPRWMWRNKVVLEFVGWLREYNRNRAYAGKVGFYGLDFYNLHASIRGVLRYLDEVDPEAAEAARIRYDCFDHANPQDAEHYGLQAYLGRRPSCENEVVEQLIELRASAAEYLSRNGMLAEDAQFEAEQNAKVVQDAEEYYRAMYRGHKNTWNLRDRHMSEVLFGLQNHLSQRVERRAKLVIWEHNSHVGDARATEMSRRDQLNVGQLVRERCREEAILIGFTTYGGTVSAASHWDAPVELKKVRPALPGSYEALFHRSIGGDFVLPLTGEVAEALRRPQLERAIGVIYLPETERWSHYFAASLPEQFDFVFHIDTTNAVQPLEPSRLWADAYDAARAPA